MIYDEVDFIERVRDKVEGYNLFIDPVIGPLGDSESMSVVPVPGGAEVVFIDGERDKTQNFSINIKTKNQKEAYDVLSKIYQKLENLPDLPSENGSYDFERIRTTSMPAVSVVDPRGFYICQVTFAADITIYTNKELN